MTSTGFVGWTSKRRRWNGIGERTGEPHSASHSIPRGPPGRYPAVLVLEHPPPVEREVEGEQDQPDPVEPAIPGPDRIVGRVVAADRPQQQAHDADDEAEGPNARGIFNSRWVSSRIERKMP